MNTATFPIDLAPRTFRRRRSSMASGLVSVLFAISLAVGRLTQRLLGQTHDPTVAIPGGQGARDCVLVIDVSPSMLDNDWPPSRLEAAKDAAKAYVRQLSEREPDARVAVVAYCGRARKACGLKSVARPASINRAIGTLRTGNWTNIQSGLDAARTILSGARSVQQVLLLSDGHHNHGGDPEPVAEDLKRTAIIECIGIGGSPSDVDEYLLKDCASPYPDGTKRYRWIGDRQRLVQEFERLAGRISRS